ncbi:MAG: hypothetical protein CSA52_02280 [Gammaproteobacteria bacterium]|nr:MAG: hypothetical protein CSB48_06265 [Pseudomonadota bacterium]PIE38418.1 MAG: hypothetical protein CSA52_02280 [Gammaproteobacteria bacterium]
MGRSQSNRPHAHRKTPYTKPPIRLSEQVAQLERRGLIISDKSNAEFYLAQLDYYRFAAYCLPFEQNHSSRQFQPNRYSESELSLNTSQKNCFHPATNIRQSAFLFFIC